MDTDVLVVGARPTGLMLANQLGRRGIRSMISTGARTGQRPGAGRAGAPRSRSCRTSASPDGRSNGANAQPAPTSGQEGGGPPASLGDIGLDLSPYPYVLILGQDDNERLLGEALRQWGMAVQWNTELVGLAQEADRVKVTLKQPDGTSREITAAWVAGCDGARSSVRGLCGIEFQGAPYEHVFFVADTQATGPMVPDELNVYLWRDGFHLFFPMRGTDHWRIVGILPPELRGRRPRFADVVPSMHHEAGTGLSFQGMHLVLHLPHPSPARRGLRTTVASCWATRASTRSARGMNTGLQDAYNLGWKLALVVSEERARRCSTPMRTSASRSPGSFSRRPTVGSRSSFPTPGWPGYSGRGSWRRSLLSR
jgi:2-polyprenyl-6-methoxyphenol hydroxylase-like FAD-dependent oxidoreductase